MIERTWLLLGSACTLALMAWSSPYIDELGARPVASEPVVIDQPVTVVAPPRAVTARRTWDRVPSAPVISTPREGQTVALPGLGPQRFDSSARWVRVRTFAVTGLARPGSAVRLESGGATLGSTVADADGRWLVDTFSTAALGQLRGQVELVATAIDERGEASTPTSVIVTVVDSNDY